MGITVKDVPAKDFIEAFSKHLKKGNKIKMPEVSSISVISAVFCLILHCFDFSFSLIDSNK